MSIFQSLGLFKNSEGSGQIPTFPKACGIPQGWETLQISSPSSEGMPRVPTLCLVPPVPLGWFLHFLRTKAMLPRLDLSLPHCRHILTHLSLQVSPYSCWEPSGSWLTHQSFISPSAAEKHEPLLWIRVIITSPRLICRACAP
uniref:Uncharacterized protein n=1 Tax=Junco hyemalis TaxID=40217 RepID=A0A8C5NL51_JUNHY